MATVRILLVDDNVEFLDSATRFLAEEAHIEIAGRALSGDEALEQTTRLRPDLVLMDLAMPGMNGLEATRQIKALPETPRVVILTLHDNAEYRAAAKAVGADGFIAKSEFSAALPAYIHELFVSRPDLIQGTDKVMWSQPTRNHVAEREEYQNRLHVQAQLLDAVEQAIIAMDLEGRVTFWNRFAERLYGWTASEVLGRDIFEIIPAPGAAEQAAEIMAQLERGQSWSGEFLFQRKEGTTLPAWVTGSPIYDDAGNLIGVIGVSTDITERVRAQQEQAQVKARAERLNRVPRAIRNVNQLIVREKDRDRLIQKACDDLIETRGYHNAWIALIDDVGEFLAAAAAGVNGDPSALLERLVDGDGAHCVRLARAQAGAHVVADPPSTCAGCPLADEYAGRAALAVRLQHDRAIYGFLVVSVPSEFATDEEERTLLEEVAGDIALALHNIESEEKRRQAEEALRLALEESRRREAEIAALLSGARAVLKHRDFEVAARAIFDACKEATGATAGYVALLNEDGSENEVLFLDSGGRECAVDPKLPMPIRGLRAEAYRTGRAVYDSDFPASEWVRFMPQGHAVLDSVMFAPLVVEGRVVGLVGLANKPGGFTDRDAQIASGFGEFAAIAFRDAQIMEALRESEQRFRMTIQRSPIGVAIVDSAGNLTDCNAALAEMVGYSREELLRLNFEDLAHPEDLEREWQLIHELWNAEATKYRMEKRYIHKEGHIVWVDVAASIFKDEAGELEFGFAFVQDITKRKWAKEALQESEEKYRTLFEAGSDALFLVEEDTLRILDSNHAAEQLYGYTRQEFMQLRATELSAEAAKTGDSIHSFSREDVNSPTHKAHALRHHRKKNGTVFPVEITANHFALRGQKINLSAIRDITKRKQAEETLQRRATQFAILNDISRQIVTTLELERVLHQAARLVQENFDYRHVGVFTREQDAFTMRAVAGDFEDRYPPGHRLDLGQGMVGWVGCHGERLLANDVEAEPRYVNLYPDRVPTRSELSVPIRVEDEVVGVLDIQSTQRGAFDESDVMLVETLADQIAVAIKNARLYEEAQAEIVERKQAEEKLQESRERFRGVFETSPTGIAIVDTATQQFLEANTSFLQMVGYSQEELRQLTVMDITHPQDQERESELVQQYLDGSLPSYAVEKRYIRKDGEIRWVHTTGDVMRVGPDKPPLAIANVVDVTERMQLERQLQQQERLAAVGQLAGGIAHDFNNILATITLYAQMLQGKRDLSPGIAENLDVILDEARRAAHLVRQILDFSSRAMIDVQPLDLKPFVESVLDILRRTIPENIHLTLDVAGAGRESYVVEADPTRIQQVLMNLAANGRDAMLPQGGGELSVALSRVTVEPGEPPPIVEMEPGEWICLTVSDTGPGMTEDVQAHLFEPFFTTKKPGKGTGLGLAQVYGIVRQHRGHIGVETAVGEGTAFHIYLPACGKDQVEETEREGPSIPPRGKGETILLAEDEAILRRVIQETLESQGYRVLTAANGLEALEIYRSAKRACPEQGRGVDILVVDLVMPEMGGQQLVEELKKEAPDLKALAITGYAAPTDREHSKEKNFLGVVSKPFDAERLAKMIRRALDAD